MAALSEAPGGAADAAAGPQRGEGAFIGELTMMRAPLDFQVLAKPLYLLKPQCDAAVIDARSNAEEAAP